MNTLDEPIAGFDGATGPDVNERNTINALRQKLHGQKVSEPEEDGDELIALWVGQIDHSFSNPPSNVVPVLFSNGVTCYFDEADLAAAHLLDMSPEEFLIHHENN